MRVLPTEVKTNGTTYTQLARRGNIALYRGAIETSDPQYRGFEVVKIRSHSGKTLPNGDHVDPAEYYPSARDWGTYGLSFQSESHARYAFDHEVACEQENSPFGSSKQDVRHLLAGKPERVRIIPKICRTLPAL